MQMPMTNGLVPAGVAVMVAVAIILLILIVLRRRRPFSTAPLRHPSLNGWGDASHRGVRSRQSMMPPSSFADRPTGHSPAPLFVAPPFAAAEVAAATAAHAASQATATPGLRSDSPAVATGTPGVEASTRSADSSGETPSVVGLGTVGADAPDVVGGRDGVESAGGKAWKPAHGQDPAAPTRSGRRSTAPDAGSGRSVAAAVAQAFAVRAAAARRNGVDQGNGIDTTNGTDTGNGTDRNNGAERNNGSNRNNGIDHGGRIDQRPNGADRSSSPSDPTSTPATPEPAKSEPALPSLSQADVRDRLLAVLLDDPARAVGAAAELEACRTQLQDVLRRLAGSGLRPEQLARLAKLSVDEVRILLTSSTPLR